MDLGEDEYGEIEQLGEGKVKLGQPRCPDLTAGAGLPGEAAGSRPGPGKVLGEPGASCLWQKAGRLLKINGVISK